MSDEASLAALRMIASEEILQNKQLLDQIGFTERLSITDSPDEALLEHAVGRIFSLLPLEIADTYMRLGQAGQNGRGAHHSSTLVSLSVFMANSTSGGRYLAAIVEGVGVHVTESESDPLVLWQFDEIANHLNQDSQLGAWRREFHGDVPCVNVYSGAACNIRDNIDNWAELVAHLLLIAQAYIEHGTGAAESAIRVRDVLGYGSDTFTRQGVIDAALAFKASLIPELQQVTHVTSGSSGVVVTVPFRVGDTTKALNIGAWLVTKTDSSNRVDIAITGHLYTTLPWEDAMRWAAMLNEASVSGRDAEEGASWVETTPWMLGRWYALRTAGPEHPVMFSGRVHAALYNVVDIEAVIRGSIREVWAASDRYRLEQEFDAAVSGITLGDIDGDV